MRMGMEMGMGMTKAMGMGAPRQAALARTGQAGRHAPNEHQQHFR